MKPLILICFILFPFKALFGQENMLIGQISGKTIVRESFNAQGVMQGKQIMKVSKLNEQKGNLEVKIQISSYDENNKLDKSYTTSFACKPNQSNLLILLIPLSEINPAKTKISSSTVGFKNMYNFKEIGDVKITVNIESGVLSFLGSRSIIEISSRKWTTVNKELESKLQLSAYALGIRIKKVDYAVKETFSNNSLIFQKFTERDGSYFTVKYA
jgi:hypothetical protein